MTDHPQTSTIDRMLEDIFSDYDSIADLSSTERSEMNAMLRPGRFDAAERYGRLIFQASASIVPEALRRAALGPIRTLRKSRAAEVTAVPVCAINRKIIELDGRGRTRRTREGLPAVCVTWDVDLPSCYAFWPALLTILEKSGVKATFNILTHAAYRLDWGFVDEVRSRGHDIGLHGATHDLALGYRSAARISDELQRALSSMPFRPRAYRAPGLCMTAELLEVLSQAGLGIDSSLPTSNMYYKSVQTSFPYRHDGASSVVEVPISLMDTNLFGDLRLDESAALAETTRVIRDVTLIGGVCTLVLHPSIAADHPMYLRGLMELLAGGTGLNIHTLTSLVDQNVPVRSPPSG